MAQIKVFIAHPTTGENRAVELPDDVSMARLLPALITRLGLPTHDAEGGLVSYRFDHKASGRTLAAEDTLSSAGVVADDQLRLRAEWTAGGSSYAVKPAFAKA